MIDEVEPVDEIEELETVDEFAGRLKVPKTWVYDRTRRGLLPFIKVGRYIRFERRKVDKALRKLNQQE
jgi:excisionase family DNA binding protein